jgi:Spy/CpxP family protein refolding chaperone
MTEQRPARNGTRLKASLLLAAVLSAGIAVGWFGNLYLGHSGHHKKRGAERVVDRLTQTLDLTTTQQDSVRVILTRRRADIDSLWTEMHPRFQVVRDRAHAEVERILTPDQQRKYRDYLDERARKRAERGR